jgi:MoxR-like ATPase
MSSQAHKLEQELQARLGHAVFGVEQVVRGLCLALVAGGHVLLEGVPGLGKTLLARTLAAHRGGRFKRIQCTSDLMPADITGVHVFNSDNRSFEFIPGPLFADVVLVDEINRTSPKTQSALLEAMEEGTVTIDRETYPLPGNHFVIASQNPHEFEGTYPLPESQLDRFLIRLDMGYPSRDMEQRVLKFYDHCAGQRRVTPKVEAPIDSGLIEEARREADGVHVSAAVYDYVSALTTASRTHPHVSLGLSTRGALAVMRCARVEAVLRAADFVTPDDIKTVTKAVVTHRLILSPDASLEGVRGDDVVDAILTQVPVPRD